MTDETIFRALARYAVEYGLFTQAEIDVIVRAGTRKQNYWARHVKDLVTLIGLRAAKGVEKGNEMQYSARVQ